MRSPFRGSGGRAVLFSSLLPLVGTACGGVTEPPAPVLENTRPTAEAVVREALARLRAEDREGLLALAMNQEEFRRIVYPRLPASRPERNTSADFIWSQHEMRHVEGFDRTFRRFRGQQWELVKLEFTGETTDYGDYRVHRNSRLVVRTPDGAERTVRLFGSMLERDGAFKIYSFIAH